jgi:hypothetical protein
MAAASCPPARPQVGFARLLVVKWVKWVCAPADCHLRLWSQPGRRGEALREGGVRAGGARAAGAAPALPLLHQRGGVLRDQRRVHACGAISAPDQRRRGQGAADRGDGGGSVDAKVVAAGSVGPTGGEVGEGGVSTARSGINQRSALTASVGVWPAGTQTSPSTRFFFLLCPVSVCAGRAQLARLLTAWLRRRPAVRRGRRAWS